MNCIHDIETKIENGVVITYCKKCGAILSTKPINYNCSCNTGSYGAQNAIYWNEGGIRDNGGSILHD